MSAPPQTAPPRRSPLRRVDWLISAALIVLSAVVYWKCCGYDYVDFDDGDYALNNPHVQGGLTADGVWWGLTTLHACNWHPVTWWSLQADAQLFGPTAATFHRTNVLLHAVNVALLFHTLRTLTGATWRSAAVASLFAVHPQHVESVAWVSERKDVLSALFFLLTLLLYTRYAAAPSLWRMLPVVVATALGVAAKPMLVTLPCVLLLLDFWPLGRLPHPAGGGRAFGRALGRLAVEKLPLFGLVTIAAFLTVVAQRAEAIRPLEQFGLSDRFGNAAVSYVVYIGQTVWPTQLCVFYPHPRTALPAWQVWCSVLILAAITAAGVRYSAGRPYLLVGWLWFVGTLVPVIGIVQVGLQARADRYMYIPHVGLFVAAVWGLAGVSSRRAYRAVLAGAWAVAVALSVVATNAQLSTWSDTTTMWNHVLAVDDDNAVAHNNLGVLYQHRTEYADALRHFDRACALTPDMHSPHFNRALVLWKMGRHDDAENAFSAALTLAETPVEFGETWGMLAEASLRRKDTAQAKGRFEKALEYQPDNIVTRNNYGVLLSLQGHTADAVREFEFVLARSPADPEANKNLGVCLSTLRRYPEAVGHLKAGVQAFPQDLEPRERLATAYLATGQAAEAREQARAAAALDREWPARMFREGWRLGTAAEAGERDGRRAVWCATLACLAVEPRVPPEFLDARAAAHAEAGEYAAAVRYAERAAEVAERSRAADLAAAIRDRLALYKANKPYHAPTTARPGTSP